MTRWSDFQTNESALVRSLRGLKGGGVYATGSFTTDLTLGGQSYEARGAEDAFVTVLDSLADPETTIVARGEEQVIGVDVGESSGGPLVFGHYADRVHFGDQALGVAEPGPQVTKMVVWQPGR